MCGISGIINFDGSAVDEGKLRSMIELIKHRGPDDEGFHIDGSIGLGHCRLSILDLSSAGHQPMCSEDGKKWITYNGEIYNYLEIRKELIKKGHKFRSDTDTEVIIHAYEEWGEDCPNKFNGMWAFAIWDSGKKELFCSRDRFGVKPFYYYCDRKIFVFASEIKSLLSLGIPRLANDDMIYDFLKYGILDHTNSTFFRGVEKLPAASSLRIGFNNGPSIKKYWDFSVSDEIRSKKKETEKHCAEFRDLFMDSVKLRLRSDVATGSCLSGGLDSSSIVCVANNFLKENIKCSLGEKQKTFSACFSDKLYNEQKYIEAVLAKTGAERNMIFPKAEEFLQDIDDLLWHQEEPFLNFGTYIQWRVMEKASEKVKVLLDGQGADENLCGYRKFYVFYLKKLIEMGNYLKFAVEGARFFSSPEIIGTLSARSGLRYFGLGNKIIGLDNLLKKEYFERYKNREVLFSFRGNLGKRIKEDVTKWSLPVLLRYEDKNSMAHSIESRVPFLDYRLVERTASFPIEEKIYGGWTKYVLREAMKNIIPDEVRLRKSKLGFSAPEDKWIKKTLMTEMKSVIKHSSFLSRYVDVKKAESELDRYVLNRSIWSGEIFFRLYVLELWGRKFMLGRIID